MPTLTTRQQRFVANKAAGLPSARAALQAGFAPNSAAVTASKLLKRSDIKRAIVAAQGPPDGKERDATSSPIQTCHSTPMEFMFAVMNDPSAMFSVRFEAAKALLPYHHAKCGDAGKKESLAAKAHRLAREGRLRPLLPPGQEKLGRRP